MSAINSSQPVPLPPLPAGPIDRLGRDLGDALPEYRDAAGHIVRNVVPGQGAPATPPAPDTPAPDETAPERSSLSRAAVLTAMGGGFAVNAIDVARLVKKLPESLVAGRFDRSLGMFGRLDANIGQILLTAPNKHVIDPEMKVNRSVGGASKSFRPFDARALTASSLLSSAVAGVQFASAIPNLVEAASADGGVRENIHGTQSGRSGVLQLAGGGMGLWMLSKGMRHVAAHEPQLTGLAKIAAAGKAPVMANPLLKYIGLASGVAVMFNEVGYFDALDKDNRRSVGETLHDAVQATPVINDPTLRTVVAGGVGALAAWKGTQQLLRTGEARIGRAGFPQLEHGSQRAGLRSIAEARVRMRAGIADIHAARAERLAARSDLGRLARSRAALASTPTRVVESARHAKLAVPSAALRTRANLPIAARTLRHAGPEILRVAKLGVQPAGTKGVLAHVPNVGRGAVIGGAVAGSLLLANSLGALDFLNRD